MSLLKPRPPLIEVTAPRKRPIASWVIASALVFLILASCAALVWGPRP